MSDLRKQTTINSNKSLAPDGTHYCAVGEGDQALMFIHGVGVNGAVWQPQIKHFSKAYKVYCYDFLGHGESPMPSDNPTLDDFVEQLNHLVEYLGLSAFALIGHSMGALIGVAFALKYPNKVNALIPINIVFNRSDEEQSRVLKRANQVISSGQVGNTKQALKRWFTGKDSAAERNKIATIGGWLSKVSPYGYGRAYRLFASSDKVFSNKLSQLQMPVLYLTGDDDANSTPAMSKQMAELTPNSEFYSIANEAHMMSYIAAGKVNTVIETFLDKNHSK